MFRIGLHTALLQNIDVVLQTPPRDSSYARPRRFVFDQKGMPWKTKITTPTQQPITLSQNPKTSRRSQAFSQPFATCLKHPNRQSRRFLRLLKFSRPPRHRRSMNRCATRASAGPLLLTSKRLFDSAFARSRGDGTEMCERSLTGIALDFQKAAVHQHTGCHMHGFHRIHYNFLYHII